METIKLNGYTIKIQQDQDAESPDSWGNNDAFLVYDHRQFNVVRKGFSPLSIFEHIQETKRLFYDGYYAFPVYAYIHSGIALSLGRDTYPFTDRFDVSFKGFCLVQRSKGMWSRAVCRKVAEGIVETWNTYLSGDVYGFIVEDKDETHIDSCWGFYGYEDCKAEAESVVAHCIREREKARLSMLKTHIKNHVPLQIRQNLLNA